MIDLERRLNEFGDELDHRVDPVSLSELADLLDDSGGVPPVGGKRPSWRVAAVAAVLVLVVVGGFALLTSWGAADSDRVGSDDQTLPSGPVEPVPGEWVLVPGGEVFERSLIGGVTFGEDGLLAVGVEKLVIDQSGEPPLTVAGIPFVDRGEQAAVWTSEDGSSWQRVLHDPAVFGVNGRLGDVVAAAAGYVIVGDADGVPAIWTSQDALTWTRVQAPPEAALLARLISTGQVIVAQGSVAGRDLNDRGIWVSPDGESWTHVDEVAWSNPPSMAAGPSFVILGEAREWLDRDQFTYTCEPLVWTSLDGLEWERHRPTGDLFAGETCLPGMVMTWFNESLIAVAAGSAWTSTDGVDWVMLPESLGAFGGGVVTLDGETRPEAEVGGLASSSNGLVAVGIVRAEEGEVGVIWTSTDGATWSQPLRAATLFGSAGGGSSVSELVATANGFVAMDVFSGQTWIWVEPAS